MTDYVAGLLTDGFDVSFVKKQRPAWQKGKYNLIGGKVEPGETFGEAMVREFEEETGVLVNSWSLFLTLSFNGGVVAFYRARVLNMTIRRVRQMEDEEIVLLTTEELLQNPKSFLPNLQWIVPLGMYTHDNYEPIHVSEANDD